MSVTGFNRARRNQLLKAEKESVIQKESVVEEKTTADSVSVEDKTPAETTEVVQKKRTRKTSK